MKLIDKIAFASFIINLIFLFSIILLPFFALFFPETFDKVFFSDDRRMFNIFAAPINLIIFFFWGYCIWFLFKYDRYSKSIFPLFFFNAIYAPVYYYRVKIRKRPLRNKINKPMQMESADNLIKENEFLELTRNNIIEVLKLWSSKEEQLEYQKNVPNVNVVGELYGQWDDFYEPGAEAIKDSFSKSELVLLEKFDAEINVRVDKYNIKHLQLDDFILTEEWKVLNYLSTDILKQIKI